MNKLYELQRHVLPKTSFSDFSELFVNITDTIISNNNRLVKTKAYKFDTWMNMFAGKKHYKYCDLGELYLTLNIIGKYKVTVTGSIRNAAFNRIDTTLIETECQDNCCIHIPNAKDYDGLYFTIFEAEDKPVEILGGSWCTDKKAEYDNNLAVCICTFKREDFITKNIEIFEKFIQDTPQLQGKIKLFISDNGKTLPEHLNSNNVAIFPNMNAGGAGGFTRALMEVLKANKGGVQTQSQQEFGRILFMDDDVEIFPESFYRTLILSNYLKPEFKTSIINGAMLDLYKKSEFFENLAIQNKLWVEAYHKSQKLDYNNILKINEIPDKIFNNSNKKADSAWWYHCFDISLAKENGLPVPVFFRGDDVEWSWRNFGKHHISMNGICVWHSPFIWRVSKVAESYYLPRNMFFINSLYTDNFKQSFKKYFIKTFNNLKNTYDYISLEILIKAMEDILKGSNVFRQNPQEQFCEINKISKQISYIDCKEQDELAIVRNKKPKAKKWRKFVHKITHEGKYCPKFLFKSTNIAPEWFPEEDYFTLVKEVKVYNLMTEKYEVRKYDRNKQIKYEKEFYNLLKEIEKNYDELHNDFVKAHKEFTTVEFWEKYLELSNEKNARKETANV